MSADYCAECQGDPRRKENLERHKAHDQAPEKPPALPGNSERPWYDD